MNVIWIFVVAKLHTFHCTCYQIKAKRFTNYSFFRATHDDEMCNFYVMYYVDGDELPHQKYCFSQGPLNWNWRDFYFHRRLQLAQAPNTISVEPETGTMYQQSILVDLPMNDKSDFSRKEQTLYNLLSQQKVKKTVAYDYLADYWKFNMLSKVI